MELEYMTISQLTSAYQGRQVSPTEVVRHLFARIEQADPKLHAFVTLTRDSALAAARAAEREFRRDGPHSPLLGVPIAHKDIFCTKGVRTTGNSRTHFDYIPSEDATVVARLARAGTISLGKTTTYEHACGTPDLFGFPVNPHNLDHISGGSSAGSAIAVAAGLAYGTTGTDTGGSIRGPAAWCGITGLKPTYGRVSRHGIFPLSPTLDHAGPFARSAADAALLLRAMSGYDPKDPTSRRRPLPEFDPTLASSLKGLRLGLPRNILDRPSLSPAVRTALMQAVQDLESLGAQVDEMSLPLLEESVEAGFTILYAEAYAHHRRTFETAPELYGSMTRKRLELGRTLLASQYLDALACRQALIAAMDQVFERFDLILSPAIPDVAAPVTEFGKGLGDVGAYSRPANVSGTPCLILPCGSGEQGLPVGLQLQGRWWSESLLLRVGHAFQQATDWHRRRPKELASMIHVI